MCVCVYMYVLVFFFYLLQASNESLVLHTFVARDVGSHHALLSHQFLVVLSLVLLPPVLRPHPLLLRSSHASTNHRADAVESLLQPFREAVTCVKC